MTDHNQLQNLIVESIAKVTLLKAEDIQQDASFESYGMDSVQLMELQAELAKLFPKLTKTVLFEYPTTTALQGYLIAQFPEIVGQLAPAMVLNDKHLEKKAQPQAGALPSAPKLTERSGLRQQVSADQLFSKRTEASLAPALNSQQPEDGAKKMAVDCAKQSISVIGMSANFPKSPDLLSFWENIAQANNCIELIPSSRWDAEAMLEDNRLSKLYALWGGFIESVEEFDHDFFNLNRTDALRLDPQLRLLLQSSWHAIEHAGYRAKALASQSVGVFVGAMNNDFSYKVADVFREQGLYIGAGSFDSELANHVSYFFDFHGPSYTVKSACSSSSTAIHLACQSIRNGECDIAIAAGVNLSLHPSKYYMLQDMKVLSSENVERTFDQDADGLIPSDGIGVLVLKRSDMAAADGDYIYANILGSAVSHAGRSTGQYIPNMKVMENTIDRCAAVAGVSLADINYVESHGTATSLGDPIELKALERKFGEHADRSELFIGTKANFGHMESASGICAVIKVILSMQHEVIAPCANLSRLNDAVCENKSFIRLPRTRTAWPASSRGSRIGAVNSFGMGGSNTFVILESVQQKAKVQSTENTELVLISAKTTAQLTEHTKAMQTTLAHLAEDVSLADVAWTSQVGREAFSHRIAILCRSLSELDECLLSLLANEVPPGVFIGSKDRAVDFIAMLSKPEGERYIRELLQAGKLDDIALLWSSGADIPWQDLHRTQPCGRVALYSYIFDKQDCSLSIAQDELKSFELNKQRFYLNKWQSALSISATTDQWYFSDTRWDTAHQASSTKVKSFWRKWLHTNKGKGSVVQLLAAADGCSGAKCAQISYSLLSRECSDFLENAARSFSNQRRIEPETLQIAALGILLNRYSRGGQPLFTFCPSSGQLPERVSPMICQIDSKKKISHWLADLQKSLELIKLNIQTEAEFLADLNQQNMLATEVRLNLNMAETDVPEKVLVPGVLTVSVQPVKNKTNIYAVFNNHLSSAAVDLFLDNYLDVLHTLVTKSERILGSIALKKSPIKRSREVTKLEVNN